jgi:hypothetical protein
MKYTYELAIPLKYLQAAISNVKSIRYNVRLNVAPIRAVNSSVQNATVLHLVDPRPYTPPSIEDMFNYEDSDFSGVYNLALKP